MAEESQSVSASQAREFLHLFRQEGRSFAGAILMQIAWVALLVLASKLTIGEPTGAGEHAKSVPPAMWGVLLINVWAVGACALFLFWLVYSGLLQQFFALVGSILKPLLNPLLLVLLVLFSLIDGLLYLLFSLVKKAQLPVWREQHKKNWIEQHRKPNPDRSPAQAAAEDEQLAVEYERRIKEIKERNGERALETLILEENRFNRLSSFSVWQAFGRRILNPMQSSVRIGLAPPSRFEHTAGHVTPLEPIPDLIRAYANAASRRKSLEAMKNVRFIRFRPVTSVSTPRAAGVWAQLLNLDYLIWCNVVTPHLHLAHVFLQPSTADPAEKPEDDPFGTQFQWNLFERNIENLRLDPPALALDTKQPVECYALFILSIAVALCKRGTLRRWEWLSSWDHSLRFRDRRVGQLVDHLAFDILPHLRPLERNNPAIPSVCEQAARFVSDWVGAQMRLSFQIDERWKQFGQERYARQLMRILEQCIPLSPDRPENWFRLGALACLLGDETKALEAFHRGSTEIPKHLKIKRIGAQVLFEQTLKFDANTGVGLNQELAWARAAAHGAIALALGGADVVNDLSQSLSTGLAGLVREFERVPAIRVIDALMAEKTAEFA